MKQAALPFDGGTADLIRERIAAFGLDLCHVEWKPGARATLTLYVDKPAGVTLGDCEIASRAASEILDPLEEKLPELRARGFLARPRPARSGRSTTASGSAGAASRSSSSGRWTEPRVSRAFSRTSSGDTLTVLDEDQHRRYTARFGDVRLARLVPEL